MKVKERRNKRKREGNVLHTGKKQHKGNKKTQSTDTVQDLLYSRLNPTSIKVCTSKQSSVNKQKVLKKLILDFILPIIVGNAVDGKDVDSQQLFIDIRENLFKHLGMGELKSEWETDRAHDLIAEEV